jgi:hypothetical protein
VGRSSPSNYTRFHNNNQFHQVNNIPLWGATQYHHIEWDKFHIKGVQKLLRKHGDQIKICICSTPKDERTSRESQWPHMQWNKEEAAGIPEKAKCAWVDELPFVLRTTPNTATQETPFFPVHGAEVVLLVEITHEAP